jgi:hypothetical protein
MYKVSFTTANFSEYLSYVLLNFARYILDNGIRSIYSNHVFSSKKYRLVST